MKRILEKIASLELREENKEELNKISEEMKNYYDINCRHSYSEVSDFIYNSKEEDFEYIIRNLSIIKKNFLDKGQNTYFINISKLMDHIQLELNREQHINKLNEDLILQIVTNELSDKIKTSKESIDDATNSMKKSIEEKNESLNERYNELESKYKKLLNKQKDRLDNLYGSIISVLGIFSAVVIAFFGGISILGSALNNMNRVSKYRLVFVLLIVGFVTFNIIFMLLHILAKLIKKNISSIKECNGISCKNCGKRITLRCMKSRHPVSFWYNTICLIGIIISFCMYIVDKYNIISSVMYKFNINNIIWIPVTGIVIVLLIIIIVAIILMGVLGIFKLCNVIFKHWEQWKIRKENNSNSASA